MSLVRQRPKTESTKHTAAVNTEKDPFIYQIGKDQTVARRSNSWEFPKIQ